MRQRVGAELDLVDAGALTLAGFVEEISPLGRGCVCHVDLPGCSVRRSFTAVEAGDQQKPAGTTSPPPPLAAAPGRPPPRTRRDTKPRDPAAVGQAGRGRRCEQGWTCLQRLSLGGTGTVCWHVVEQPGVADGACRDVCRLTCWIFHRLTPARAAAAVRKFAMMLNRAPSGAMSRGAGSPRGSLAC